MRSVPSPTATSPRVETWVRYTNSAAVLTLGTPTPESWRNVQPHASDVTRALRYANDEGRATVRPSCGRTAVTKW
jgi:hypothetical protein